jgi:hypothetical protein
MSGILRPQQGEWPTPTVGLIDLPSQPLLLQQSASSGSTLTARQKLYQKQVEDAKLRKKKQEQENAGQSKQLVEDNK